MSLILGALPRVLLLILSPPSIGVASTTPGEPTEALAEATALLVLPLISLRLIGRLLLGIGPRAIIHLLLLLVSDDLVCIRDLLEPLSGLAARLIRMVLLRQFVKCRLDVFFIR